MCFGSRGGNRAGAAMGRFVTILWQRAAKYVRAVQGGILKRTRSLETLVIGLEIRKMSVATGALHIGLAVNESRSKRFDSLGRREVSEGTDKQVS